MAYQPATLTGLPRELGSMIAGYLPPKAVGIMQRTSKRTQQISRVTLMQLCETLPDEDELREYIAYMDEIHSTRIICKYAPDVARIARARAGYHATSYSLVDVDGWKRIRTLEEGEFTGIPDPRTVFDILRRRVGCRKDYLNKYSMDGYGLNIVRTYLRGVLRPFLLPIIGQKEDMLFDPTAVVDEDDDMEEFMLPIPTGKDDAETLILRKKYQNNMQQLRFLVLLWLDRVSWEFGSQYIDNDDENNSAEGLVEGAVELIQHIHKYSNRLVNIMEQLDKEREDSLPNHVEVIRWIRKMLTNKEKLRVGFLDREYKVTILQVFLDGNVDISPNNITLEGILNNLPGRVDPTTLLTMMRERPGKVKEDYRYGINQVQTYVRDIQGATDYNKLVDDEDGKVYLPKGVNSYAIVSKLRSLAIWMDAGTLGQRMDWDRKDKLGKKTNSSILRGQAQQVVSILSAFYRTFEGVASYEYEEEDEEEDEGPNIEEVE